MPGSDIELEARIASERFRHDRIYASQREALPTLRLRPNAEHVPNDLRAALLHALAQLGDLQGKRVLEIGAGTGWDTVVLARRGARIVATDVSSVGIESARQRFLANDISDRAEALEMPAEMLAFQNESFDLIFGRAVLHHLDMDLAPRELSRVLTQGGRAVFMEPLSENPVLDFVRDYVPYRQKKSPLGHRGIKYATISKAGNEFSRTECREFYITSMLNRALGHHVSLTPLESLDGWIVKHVPPMRRLGRYVVVTFTK